MNNWFEEISGFFDYLNTNEFAAWTLLLTVVIGLFLFVWTTREIANWFLRTKTILDEQRRLTSEFKDINRQITKIEQTLLEIKTNSSNSKQEEKKSPDVELRVSSDQKSTEGFEVTH